MHIPSLKPTSKPVKITVAAVMLTLGAATLATVGGLDQSVAGLSMEVSNGSAKSASKLEPARQLSGAPTINTTKVVERTSDPTDLPYLHSEKNSYYCGGYDRVLTPDGDQATYPYYRGSYNWRNLSTEGVSAVGDSYNVNGVTITFTNWSAGTKQSKIAFDCTGIRYDPHELEAIDVNVVRVAQSAAEIGMHLDYIPANSGQATKWHVEYGTDNYAYRTADSQPGTRSKSQSSASQIIGGLKPGTRYQFRVVVYDSQGKPNYSTAGNTFTTPEEPKADQVYGLADGSASTWFLEDPNASADYGTKVQMATGSGVPGQQWQLEKTSDPDGYLHLRNAVNGLCAGIYGGDIADNPIDLWACDINEVNESNQLWKPVVTENGSYRLQSKAGLFLSLTQSSPTPGQNLVAKQSGGSTWQFVPLS